MFQEDDYDEEDFLQVTSTMKKAPQSSIDLLNSTGPSNPLTKEIVQESTQKEDKESKELRLKKLKESLTVQPSSNNTESTKNKTPKGFKNSLPSTNNKQLQIIKNHYMGIKEKRKRPIKKSDKYRKTFNFGWDAIDDTSFDHNPLYNERHDFMPLFGKGRIAGVDNDVQERKGKKYERMIADYGKSRSRNKKRDSKRDKKSKKYKSSRRRRSRGRRSRSRSSSSSSTSKSPRSKRKTGFRGRRHRQNKSQKNWKDKNFEEMSDRDWKIFREDNAIQIFKGRKINPIRNWKESTLLPQIKDNLKKIGYKIPTPIQMQSINMGLFRRDMVGLAPTGSGKSAAFLLPLINYVLKIDREKYDISTDGPHAIVLSPTRELCIQISEEFDRISKGLNVTNAICVGGRSIEDQENDLRNGVDIIFATPGRFADILGKSLVVLSQCYYVVIDEFDIMIDLDLEEDLNYILECIPAETLKSNREEVASSQEMQSMRDHAPFRTTHLFSATMPDSLRETASKYLRCPAWVCIGDPGEANRNILHEVALTTEESKKGVLTKWIHKSKPQMIVFCNSQDKVEMVGKYLKQDKFRIGEYHGKMNQYERETTIQKFKKGRFDILVATDLAGRGLDVAGVNQIINFDCPKSIESYVHRAGRTGRAGRKGNAVTFLTEKNKSIYYSLVKFLKKNSQKIPKELENHEASFVKPGSELANRANELIRSQRNELMARKNMAMNYGGEGESGGGDSNFKGYGGGGGSGGSGGGGGTGKGGPVIN